MQCFFSLFHQLYVCAAQDKINKKKKQTCFQRHVGLGEVPHGAKCVSFFPPTETCLLCFLFVAFGKTDVVNVKAFTLFVPCWKYF